MPPTLTAVSAREVVHLLILRRLAGIRRGAGITVKGGVNLRLFFGSVRYSEDMDLDGTTQASEVVRETISSLFESEEFTRQLRAFGIRELDPGEGPNKNTGTTFRYKFGVVVPGGVRYSTKVEISFRDRHAADKAVRESPWGILRAYGMEPLEVQHYVKEAAVRQKLDALSGRREAQARDVFDLHILAPDPVPDSLVDFLGKYVATAKLTEAHNRALAITYEEYKGQVFEFLSDDARERHGTESTWDEMRLQAAGLIENVLSRQEKK
jgi:predicted nucleotidyltransferase component of viral defense system